MQARQKVVMDEPIDRDITPIARNDDEACCSVFPRFAKGDYWVRNTTSLAALLTLLTVMSFLHSLGSSIYRTTLFPTKSTYPFCHRMPKKLAYGLARG